MVKTIGFVGVGPINLALAQFSINSGYKVIVSNSRGPDTLSEIVKELGDNAFASTVQECCKNSDIVIISIPLDIKILEKLNHELFSCKIVIDTMNYYPQRTGKIEILENRELTSSELVQKYLYKSYIIKAFYNLDFVHLKNGPKPENDSERWALPIAGDNIEAKKEVSIFMNSIGFDSVDCGSLADSWKIQQATPVYVHPYIGTMPEGLTKEEEKNWFMNDRSKVIKKDDILRLANEAKKTDRVGALFEELPQILSDFFPKNL